MNGLKVLCIQWGILSCVLSDVLGCNVRTAEAVCNLRPNPTGPESAITGTVRFTQRWICYQFHWLPLVKVQGEITGLAPCNGTRKHGFHVHERGDLSEGCQSTGSHYNPLQTVHGRRADVQNRRHVGDLGNVIADRYGNVTFKFFAPFPLSLFGEMSVVGRAIVLHAGEDDLGRGGNAGSRASGNAGARIACCVIERVEHIV